MTRLERTTLPAIDEPGSVESQVEGNRGVVGPVGVGLETDESGVRKGLRPVENGAEREARGSAWPGASIP